MTNNKQQMTPIIVCKRHPETETGLRCIQCNTPICAKCAQKTPVGYRCLDCATEIRERYIDLKGAYANPYHAQLATPFLTYVILGLIVVIWFWTEIADGSKNEVLIRFGSTAGWLMLEQNELWRLFTAMFLHADGRHLGFNALALVLFGLEGERLFGQARFLFIYIFAGLFGGLLSFALRGVSEFSVGASGAIFGLMGMLLVFFAFHYHRLGDYGKQRIKIMLMFIGFNVIIGFSVMRINNAAHMGGLISGAILGFLLTPRHTNDPTATNNRLIDTATLPKRWWVVVLTVILFIVCTMGIVQYWLET